MVHVVRLGRFRAFITLLACLSFLTCEAEAAEPLTPEKVREIVGESLRTPEELTEFLGRPVDRPSALLHEHTTVTVAIPWKDRDVFGEELRSVTTEVGEEVEDDIVLHYIGSPLTDVLIIAERGFYEIDQAGRVAYLRDQEVEDRIAEGILARAERSSCSGGLFATPEGNVSLAYIVVNTLELPLEEAERCVRFKLYESAGFRLPRSLLAYPDEVVDRVAQAGVNALYQCAVDRELEIVGESPVRWIRTTPLPDAECVIEGTLANLR